jgi:hypothetical protein
VFQAKQFYLEQLKDGPLTHKILTRRLQQKFRDSAVEVREALLRDKLIELVDKQKRKDGRYNYRYKLTGKELVAEKPQLETEWDDGTAKSSGNAFDWRSKSFSLFNKQELAVLQQSYKPMNQVIAYSRA